MPRSVYNSRTYNTEIHPGVPPFSKAMGFRVGPGRHLCSLPQLKRNSSEGLEEMDHNGGCDRQSFFKAII